MLDTYTCRRFRSVGPFDYRADFAQASCPILLRFDRRDEWQSTPFRVADAGHSRPRAERMIARYLRQNAG